MLMVCTVQILGKFQFVVDICIFILLLSTIRQRAIPNINQLSEFLSIARLCPK